MLTSKRSVGTLTAKRKAFSVPTDRLLSRFLFKWLISKLLHLFFKWLISKLLHLFFKWLKYFWFRILILWVYNLISSNNDFIKDFLSSLL